MVVNVQVVREAGPTRLNEQRIFLTDRPMSLLEVLGFWAPCADKIYAKVAASLPDALRSPSNWRKLQVIGAVPLESM